MAATKPPLRPAPTTPAAAPARAPAPRLPPKIRAGMGDVTTEFVEVYSDDAYQRATGGLFSCLGVPPETHTKIAAEQWLERVAVPSQVSSDVWRSIYRAMLQIRQLDAHLRGESTSGQYGQYGRADLPAHFGARGHEAAVIAPVAALLPGDWVVPGHSQSGVALFRGMPLNAYVAGLLGNANDISRGRQAPAHPAMPRALNVLPSSQSTSTKLPQAAGIAWAAKIKRESTAVLCFLNHWDTYAEDFHAGLNFAAVFRAPVVFVCIHDRNSGAGGGVRRGAAFPGGAETIAVKALAYGMPGVRVDGGDVLALFDSTRDAIAKARAGDGPTLIEAVIGDSTSDRTDPADGAPVKPTGDDDPLTRFERWLNNAGILGAELQAEWSAAVKAEVRKAFADELRVGPPDFGSLIDDVYLVPTAALVEQLSELARTRVKS